MSFNIFREISQIQTIARGSGIHSTIERRRKAAEASGAQKPYPELRARALD